MKYLFEYSDILNAPLEAFLFDANKSHFPIQTHWHYYVEMIYILEGTAWVTCNQKTYMLHPSEMIFLPPQAMHSIYTTTSRPLVYAVIKFDANHIHLPDDYLPHISTLFRTASQLETLPITFTQEDFKEFSLADFFTRCITEMEQKNYGYDSYLTAQISLFLIHMFRIWHTRGLLEETNVYEKEEDYSIHDILLYIDQHSQEKLLVEDLAAMCHMSYSYFAKTFHKLYGQSCKEYIAFIRLSKAENLLRFTNYDLTYISAETGFADCSHLIRIFKRKYQMTPKQYRMKYHQ